MLIWSLLSTELTPELPGAGCRGWWGIGGRMAGAQPSVPSQHRVWEHFQLIPRLSLPWPLSRTDSSGGKGELVSWAPTLAFAASILFLKPRLKGVRRLWLGGHSWL